MKRKVNSWGKGFLLIELIVSLFLLSMLSVVLTAGYVMVMRVQKESKDTLHALSVLDRYVEPYKLKSLIERGEVQEKQFALRATEGLKEPEGTWVNVSVSWSGIQKQSHAISIQILRGEQ